MKNFNDNPSEHLSPKYDIIMYIYLYRPTYMQTKRVYIQIYNMFISIYRILTTQKKSYTKIEADERRVQARREK